MPTYSPTVLVVDDDPAFVRYVRREFHNNTSVGVLVAKDIQEGRALAESAVATIDALLTDLFFEAGKDLPSEGLYDGIDLAAAINRARPSLPTYILSYFSDDPALHEKATRCGVNPVRWLPKSWMPAAKRKEAPEAPWHLVEMDLVRRHISTTAKSSVEKQVDTNAPGDPVSLAVKLRRPQRTYIQSLPDPHLRVTRPIEVICTLDEEMARAVAPALGLLEEGYGETVEEALEALAEIVKNHYEHLAHAEVIAADYANVVKERIMSFVTRE